jgi:ribosomal protein S18 acetylase RimI-like enzyme
VTADLPAGWSIRRPTLDDVPAILALVHASDIAAVGEPDFTTDEVLEILNAPNHDPRMDSWLAINPEGRLGGWAYLDNPTRGTRENVEVYVHPDDGAPAQAPLLGRGVVRIAERAAELGYPSVTARAGAIASEKHYIAVLGEAGFRFVKRYARMRRDLTGDESAPEAGVGVTVRNVRPDDDADMRTFFDILKTAFEDIPDSVSGDYDDYRARVAALSTVSWDEWYVAEVDGVPAAVLQSADQTAEQNEGWVKNLGVDRRWRGRGLGRLLLLTAFAQYASKGRRAAGLGVDMTNPTSAYRLYESVAMYPVYEADVYERQVTAL